MPGPVEPLGQEALEDLMVEVLEVGWRAFPVARGYEDVARVHLLGPIVEALPFDGHFHPLGKFLELGLIAMNPWLGIPEVHRRRGTRDDERKVRFEPRFEPKWLREKYICLHVYIYIDIYIYI
jgi:hypothetical protein